MVAIAIQIKTSPVTYPKQKRNIKPIEKELGKMLVTDIKPSQGNQLYQ